VYHYSKFGCSKSNGIGIHKGPKFVPSVAFVLGGMLKINRLLGWTTVYRHTKLHSNPSTGQKSLNIHSNNRICVDIDINLKQKI